MTDHFRSPVYTGEQVHSLFSFISKEFNMDSQSSVFQAKPCRTCTPAEKPLLKPLALVIFGGSGDLSQRKLLPALYHLYRDGLLPEQFCIVGIGRTEYSREAYQKRVENTLKEHLSDDYHEQTASEFAGHCLYQSGNFQQDEIYGEICRILQESFEGSASDILFYLAVPPDLLSSIVAGLKKFQLCGSLTNSKIIVEKPFGRDQSSAHELNAMLLDAFEEKRIYRIDHYLGKETVQNILFFRFGNSMFEPLWNHKYIDHVQITVAETMGIGHRGNFYEQTGVIRDLVQNHILQLLALVAMEPPAGFDGDLVRDEKVKVYRSIRPAEEQDIQNNMVRGQYGKGQSGQEPVPGYREEEHVHAGSNTPTFFAGKFFIDNWRWAGVPFYIRTGKRLLKRVSEIYIQFQQPPQKLFGSARDPVVPGGIILGIQPEEEIVMRLNIKYPGMGNQPHPVEMVLNYSNAFQTHHRPAYERLLLDAVKGDLTLFARMDGVEAMWAIVDPIIQWWETHPAREFPNYKAGTWGPDQAQALIRKDGRMWRI